MLFDDIRVFDGEKLIERTRVLVEDGRIAAIGPDLPRHGTTVDGRGRTLLPGLIDAHVHISPGAGRAAIGFGVTTQLDLFADPAVAHELKEEAAATNDVADLRSAGTGATAPGGHPSQLAGWGLFGPFPTISEPHEAADFVAERVAEGSDYLKIFTSSVPGEPDLPVLSRETVVALVQAAHAHGLIAIAHATDLEAAEIALAAGVDGLAHLPFDGVLTKSSAFVIATLGMAESFCHDGSIPELGAKPADKYRAINAKNAVAKLEDVEILAGSDAPAPGATYGASLHRELELLVEAGLTPEQALTAATSAPARCFGLTDRGRIKAGLNADLLLVNGDPTQRIADTAQIELVLRNGHPAA